MNLVFLITAWESFKKFLVATKDFCIKYWKLLVAGILVLVGYVLGRRNDNAAVIREDLKATEASLAKQRDDAINLTKEHLENKEKLLIDYEKRINEIEDSREKIIDDLSNNDEKLDNILKEKYDLKKGD